MRSTNLLLLLLLLLLTQVIVCSRCLVLVHIEPVSKSLLTPCATKPRGWFPEISVVSTLCAWFWESCRSLSPDPKYPSYCSIKSDQVRHGNPSEEYACFRVDHVFTTHVLPIFWNPHICPHSMTWCNEIFMVIKIGDRKGFNNNNNNKSVNL